MAPENDSLIAVDPSLNLKPQSSLVRYALLTAVILSLLFSSVFGAIGFVVLNRIGSQMTDLQENAVILHVFVQIFFALCCFMGIYACIVKHMHAASLFMSFVMGQILFSISSGAACLYLLFNATSSQPWNVNQCLTSAFDEFTRQLCKKTMFLKGMGVAMFVVLWLVEIATIVLGNAFLFQLRQEEADFDVLDPKYDLEGSGY